MLSISRLPECFSGRLRWWLLVILTLFLSVNVQECAAQESQPRGPQLVLQTGHGGRIKALAFTPSGRLLASGGWDHLICLWDVATGLIVRRLEGHAGAVNALAFSPDGKLLASGSDDDSTIVWDVNSGRMLRRFLVPPGSVNRVAFSPDGRLLAAGSYLGTSLWVISTGMLLEALTTKASAGYLLGFSADGHSLIFLNQKRLSFWDYALKRISRQFAVAGLDSREPLATSQYGRVLAINNGPNERITISDPLNGKTISKASVGPGGPYQPMTFTADGTILAGLGSYVHKTVQLWDVATGQGLRVLPKASGDPIALAFSPDGNSLAVAYDSPHLSIKLWNVATGSPILDLWSKVERARDLLFYQDRNNRGLSLIVGSDAGMVDVWNLPTARSHRTLQGGIYSFHMKAGEVPLIVASRGDKTDFIDANTGSIIRTADFNFLNPGSSWSLSPDGSLLAYTEQHKGELSIKVNDFSTGRELRTLASEAQQIRWLTFSKDNHWLLSETPFASGCLWDLTSGEKKYTFEGREFNLSPDGQRLAYHSLGRESTVFDLRTREKRIFQVAGGLMFSPSGRYLAGAVDQRLHVWEVASGRRIFLGPVAGSRRFSPDEQYIVTSKINKPLQMWEIATGRELLPELPRVSDSLTALAFSPDSRWLATTAADGSVKLWDVAAQRLVASLYMGGGRSWLVTTPAGFFDASDEAARKMIAWKVANVLYPAEHLAKQRYRPGLLADIFAGTEVRP